MNCYKMQQTKIDLITSPPPHPGTGDREACRPTPEEPATAPAVENRKGPAAGRIRFFHPLPRDVTQVALMLQAAGWSIVFVSGEVASDGRHRITAREPLHGVELEAALLSDEVAAEPIAWHLNDDFTHASSKGPLP